MRKFKMLTKKLAIIDWLIIFITIIGVSFFAYYFFRKPSYKTVVIKINEDTVRYEPWARNVENPTGNSVWFSRLFSPGVVEKDGLGKVTAEIISVYSYDTAPGRKAVYLTTNLNATYNRATNQFTYKGKPLIVGSMLKISFDGVYVEGMVTGVTGLSDPIQQKNIIVEAQLKNENQTYLETSGVAPEIAESLNKAFEIKDGNGEIIAKITDLKIQDSKRLVVMQDGKTQVQTNPLRKDVFITLEINAQVIDDKFFMFDDVPILIGQPIPLNTKYYSIFPEVTDIQIEKQ